MNLYLSAKNGILLKEMEGFARDFPDIAPVSCDYTPLLTVMSPGVFQIDIKPIILGDNVYVDTVILDRMLSDAHIPSDLKAFCKELQKEGFVRAIETGDIASRYQPDLVQLLERDIDNISTWLELYRNYRAQLLGWHSQPLGLNPTDFDRTFLLFDRIFVRDMMKYAEQYHLGIEHVLPYFMEESNHRLDLTPEVVAIGRELLRPLLEYLNHNFVIAASLEAELYDWKMLHPAYNVKMQELAAKSSGTSQTQALSHMFDLFFPDLNLTYPSADLPKLLKSLSKRELIEELRQVVRQATRGEITLDQNYLHSTFREILGHQASFDKRNTIISWFSFVGGVILDLMLQLPIFGSALGKTSDEIARRVGKKDHWYFLFHSNG